MHQLFSGAQADLRDSEMLPYKDSALFAALVYFEIFNFPLTLEEIWKFSAFESRAEMKRCLGRWVLQGYILRDGRHYMLSWREDKLPQRLQGEKRARGMWEKARKRARLIQSFPFIEAVFISGSVSKGVVAPDGDVDFFMITRPGRLWISRTLLVLYKKIFLLGSHRYFCVNYFIDSRHLEIEEQNRFTATEMATLIPMTGDGKLVGEFFRRNPWVWDYYPNFTPRPPLMLTSKKPAAKRLLESLLDLFGARVLDKAGRWLTTGFWRIKFREMTPREFNLALKSREYVSKHHPLQFQKKVLQAFDAMTAEFEENHQMKLDL